ncbi:YraN family protein [Ancylobacter sp. G4_0304]|uniref:YraN family protein n=1 Tax=Ancylobacter sp. G4_0304 TaxID=3114289 RepID=UPI0039C6582D
MAKAPKTEPSPARRAAFARGLDAEAAAGALLAAQGFAVLATRVRTPRGEIDLIARRGDLLVFVEVKARARLDAAAEAVSPRQRRRIAAAAEIYLAGHPEFAGLDMRLDAILIAPGVPALHLPGAFEAE